MGTLDGDLSGDKEEEKLPGTSPKLLCTACTAFRDENLSLRRALDAKLIVDADA